MNVAERIKRAREDAGLTQTDLGDRCGIHRRDIGKYENGTTRNIPLANLERIAGALNRPLAWFFMEDEAADGPGPLGALVDDVARDPSGPLTPRQVQALAEFFREFKRGAGAARAVEHADLVELSPRQKEDALKQFAQPAKIHRMPRLHVAEEKAAAGRAADDLGPPEDLLLAQHRWKDDYKPFRIVGDSMAPFIMNGDYVVADLVRRPVDGDTVLARTADGLVVKQFFKKKDHVELVSINPEYEPVSTADVAILGVLIDIVRPVKKITE